MTQRKFMQYNHEQDNITFTTVDRTMTSNDKRTIGWFRGPLAKELFGEGFATEYADVLEGLANKKATVLNIVDYNLQEEIALYNALRRMERTNPSASRIQDEFKLNADDVGLVVGRDFKSNQPIFYETRVLQSDSRFKDYLDEKLGPQIVGPSSPIGRLLFIGSPELLGRDHMDTSAGRLVGVVPENR